MAQICYYCKRTIEDENDMVVKNITDFLSFQNEQRVPFHRVCWQERCRKKRRKSILTIIALISLPIFLILILPQLMIFLSTIL